MKQYCLTIASKNERSLESFLNFFSKYSKTQFNILNQSTKKKTKRQFFSLLKSPHVNKTAQEQFEFRTFIAKINVTTSYSSKNFIFLKKLANQLFHDVSINLRLSTSFYLLKKNKLIPFYPDNFKFFNKQYTHVNYKQRPPKESLKNKKFSKLVNVLKIFDIFGETLTNQV